MHVIIAANKNHKPFRDPSLATLEIQHLSRPGLEPASFRVDAGSCLSLSGPSGAGKSLLLRAIADMDPHDGEVLLDSRSFKEFSGPDWRRQVMLVPAESSWWWPTVGEHFEQIEVENLERLGFEAGALSWRVDRLSTGEKQRLALLRALSRKPAVLLLDEPTAALDADSIHAVEALIGQYRQQQGAAVIWVSHDAAQIARVADRQLKIRNGKVVPNE